MVDIIKKGFCVGMAGLMGGHSTIAFAKGSEDYYQCQESVRLYSAPCAPKKDWPEDVPHLTAELMGSSTVPGFIEGFARFPPVVIIQQMLPKGDEVEIRPGSVVKSS